MELLKLDIQMFSDGKIVIDTQLDTKNFEKGLNTIQGKAKSGGSAIKNIVAGLGITKLIGAAFNTISNSMDKAINRFDTMNNFSKVMTNLGVSSEAADKSVKKLSDGIQGLPTTLDSAALSVQRFTSKNGDVEKSTDIFLALNDAILAGGAPAETQANALEQMTQAYTRGKFELKEWQALQQAMPGQLKQVGEAMGYVNTDDLYEAMKNGEVSMDDFMATIQKLDTEGINGLASFHDAAFDATEGIATSMENFKSRVAIGVTDIIDALNMSFENTKFGSLAGFISESGTKAKEALQMVADLIRGDISGMDFGKNIGDTVNKALKQLTEHLPKFLDAGIKLILEIINGLVQAAPDMIDNFVDLIIGLSDVIYDNLDLFLDAALKIIVTLVQGIANNADKLINNFIVLTMKLIDTLTSKDYMQKLANAALKIIVALAKALLQNAPTIVGAIVVLGGKLLTELLKLPGKMWDIGKNIVQGIWNGIKAKKDELIQKVKNFGSSIINGLKAKLGIHSPSTVFRDEVGKMIAAGIGVGFEEGIDDVYKDMQDAIDLETSKMSANVQSSGTYQMAMANTPTFNLVDNATNKTQLTVDGKVLAEVVNTENRNREVAKA